MIYTERLLLRPFNTDDADIAGALYTDDVIMRYMPYDCRDEKRVQVRLDNLVAEWEKQPILNREYAVLKKNSGEQIGRCHLQWDTDSDTAMVGWLLLEKEWSKGYATEITLALMKYAFEELGAHRVAAICNPENTPSRRVMEKCGMRCEALYLKKCRYIKKDGISWNDEAEYAILREEWAEKHR